jgi:lipopolysaccharide biosynthesis glycosyltransferase
MLDRKNKVSVPPSRFPILFAIDVEYIPHLATALYSLLLNNQSIFLRIIVFTAGIPKKDYQNLEQICGAFNTPLKLIQLEDNSFEDLPLRAYFKKSTYYRLFAADLIQDDKCLYLDSDVIINGSLTELINLDVNNYYLAAIQNHDCCQVFNRHKSLGMRLDSKYFNSGVMLINLNKWRNTNLKDSVITFIRNTPEMIRFADQCGLNAIVNGDFMELDEKYNCQSCLLTTDKHADVACINVIRPVVMHFTGANKPWHVNYNHPHKKLYWSYRNKTTYNSFFVDHFRPVTISRYFLSTLFKKMIKLFSTNK